MSFSFLLLVAMGARGASLDITVKDAKLGAVEDAVVYAMQKSGAKPDRAQRPAEIAQKDKQFVPPVSVVQVGASVQFPNRDPFRHHVYSFSAAKNFEIKLYAGTPAAPVLFDKPGEVVLGCNIHDNMVGYVYVVDTPFFAKTDKAGRARLEGLPAGDYDVMVWHFAQSAPAMPRAVSLKGDDVVPVAAAVALKPVPPRPPS